MVPRKFINSKAVDKIVPEILFINPKISANQPVDKQRSVVTSVLHKMERIISKNPSVLLVLLVLLPSVIYAQIAVRLDNTLVVPHHYNVDLTIGLSTYTVEETVLITLLQDSQEITFNFRGQNGGWFQTRLLTADGQPLNPPLTIPRFTLRDNTVTLTFSDVIPRGTYTLHFAAFQGQFGTGLIQVPLPDPNKYV